jgi:hypothetical protein
MGIRAGTREVFFFRAKVAYDATNSLQMVSVGYPELQVKTRVQPATNQLHGVSGLVASRSQQQL